MRVLLLNPPGNEYLRAGSRWPHKRTLDMGPANYHPFPFALAYAAARLRQEGHTVSLKDCPVLRWGDVELNGHINAFRPDILIAETSAPSYERDRLLPKNSPSIPVCAAGFFATAEPARHLSDGFRFIFKGEYEYLLPDFLAALEKQAPLPPYIGTAALPAAQYAPLLQSLDLLPWPLREEMDIRAYHDPFSKGLNIAVLSSKGCANNCSFCMVTPYSGHTGVRVRDPVKVVNEIDWIQKRFAPDEIMLDDDSITLDKAHLLALCREISARLPGLQWSAMGNVPVDEETAGWLRKSGCRALKIGVESGVQEVLDAIPKNITLPQIRETFARLKAHGIRRHATLMVGLPGDTPERVDATMDFVLSLNPDTVQISTAIPYPGTRLYEKAKKEKWLVSEEGARFNGAGDTPLSYPGFSDQQIRQAYRRCLGQWHRFLILKRPGTVLHHLSNIIRRFFLLPGKKHPPFKA